MTRWLVVLTALVVGSWLVGAVLVVSHGLLGGGNGQAPNNGGAVPAGPVEPALKPWGVLEYVPISISPPLELIPEFAPHESHELEWRFPQTSSSQLVETLSKLGLSESLRKELIELAQLDATINGYTIRPSQELALGLGPEDRSKLYVALAAYPENRDQMKAFRFCGESAEQWFNHAPISPETKRLVTPLIYRQNGYLFFADLRLVEDSLPSADERAQLIKALSRESTFLVKLRVSRDSDIEALVNYWGRGGRAKDVRPILESLGNLDQSQSINIGYLLPPFARQRLWTYPVPPEKGAALNRDCHWTAFNFFAHEPDDRFCLEAEVVRTVENDYYRVYANLQLGDVVMFFTDASKAIHSAVYVADGVLFTKNGSLSSRPWMLMRLEDMKGYYPTLKPLDVRYYRRKDL